MQRRSFLALSLAAAPAAMARYAAAEEAVPGLRRLQHGWQVLSVAWSANGRYLGSGGADRTARIWNARTGELERSLPEEC